MMKSNLRYITYLPMLLLAGVFGGCSQDETAWDEATGTEVRFDETTVLMSAGRAMTRAIDPKDDINGLYAGIEASDTTVYFTADSVFNWGTIKMYMTVDGASEGGIVDYKIQTGVKGQLKSETDGTSLKWKNSTASHTFYAWTMPATNSKTTEKEEPCNPRDPKHPEYFQKARNPKAIEMNADGKTGIVNFGTRADINNNILEYFVGTKTGPVTHKENGLSVNMIFRHLVTKVYINGLYQLRNDGTTKTLSGSDFLSIYFPDMPRQGIFNTGIGTGDFPSVTAKAGAECGVESRYYHLFYLPPFEFEKCGRFEVTVEEATSSEKPYEYITRTYYGHLKDIAAGTGLKELKAGEAMTLDLVLADGKVTGMSVYIRNWNDRPEETVSQQVKKGIYTSKEFYRMRDHPEEYWSGVTDADGKKIIWIYNNITIPGNQLDYGFNISEGYVLYGMGHNIIKENGKKFWFYGEGSAEDFYVYGEPYSYTPSPPSTTPAE